MQFRNPIDSSRYRVEIALKKTNRLYFAFTYSTLGSFGFNPGLVCAIFPDIEKYINLHLSDENGIPMYALENGFYYLQNPKEYKTSVVAEHFRISIEEAKELQEKVASGQYGKSDLAVFIENQKARWKQEADECLNWIESLDDTKMYRTHITRDIADTY